MAKRKVAAVVLLMTSMLLVGSLAFAVFGINVLTFPPVAGAGLRVDSTTCIGGAGAVVIDKVFIHGQATSTAAATNLVVALRGGTGMPISLKTVLYTFGAEEAVNTNWFSKEYTGPYVCTADSPLVFHLLGANIDSLGAVINYHYAR